MGDLTKNLSRHEFACQCGCGFDTADVATVNAIQGAADHFMVSYGAKRIIVTITSGCRCVPHNTAEKGADESQHIYARGVDHVIEIVTQDNERVLIPEDILANYYEDREPLITGVGRYPSGRVHMDSGTGKNRPFYWDKR